MTALTIRLERPGTDHARLVVARPGHKNALRIEDLRQLAEAVETLSNSAPRVLSIVAEGTAFGVGGDIEAFGEALARDEMGSWLQEAVGHFHAAIAGLRQLDSAIVVGVQGAVAGGTLGLVWAADHVIAAHDLSLNLAYARLGASPDGGTSWFLPRLLNPLRAFELFTLTPTLGPEQAQGWGLVNRVVPRHTLEAAVDEVARAWLAVPPQSLKNFKRLLRSSEAQTLGGQLQNELEAFVEAGQQPEFAQRVKDFLARRPQEHTDRTR